MAQASKDPAFHDQHSDLSLRLVFGLIRTGRHNANLRVRSQLLVGRIDSGFVATANNLLSPREFERRFESETGVRHLFAVASVMHLGSWL